MKNTLFILFVLSWFCTTVNAQKITGVILDDTTGESIPFASVIYRGNHVMAAADIDGKYAIERHNGWYVTFSAVGYQPQQFLVSKDMMSYLTVRLKPETAQLQEVTVKAKREHYSRKNNPAVELMERVIAAKKRTRLENHDYYQYNKYQKMTLAFNDLTPTQLESGMFKNREWMVNHVEVCNYNNKLILPINVNETVTQHVYRKSPKSEKDIIIGENATGINDFFETGDIITTTLQDVFTDVDIYDNEVRLLQYPFTSPIANNAISFYRYYIVDTVKVDRDSCFHIHFMPNNQQDFGFRGDLYILTDSSLHVKKCSLTIPKKSDVNFVDNLTIEQAYTRLPSGDWVLTTDDMIVELSIAKFLSKAIVIRTTRLQDYSFDEIQKSIFKGKAKQRHEANAQMRDEKFWNQYRTVDLTRSESNMSSFLQNIENIKGFKYFIFVAKAFIENYVDTGTKDHPSKIDIGPINTIFSQNFIDGLRLRGSLQTTANLNRHWFVSGYYAHGFKSKKDYYKGELVYSFNPKDYLPREFPKRTITFNTSYDVCSPSDKFINTDKDNVFTSFHWSKVDKMMFYNRQELKFEHETDFGFKTTLGFKTEENEACGSLYFTRLSEAPVANVGAYDPYGNVFLHNGKLRTTELALQFRLAPGETYINTKQRRITVNLDIPVFTIGHRIGFNKLLGGQVGYHLTEASIYKRFWLPHSWGKVDLKIKGGVQWSRVPFPLLIMPAANLSYIMDKEAFNLVNNMEFLNDRFVSGQLSWDMNGKILNRIPLIRRLKWREYVGVNMLWGTLTDKNNPFIPENQGKHALMYFPETSYIMDSHRPYFEIMAGIHNIFKILHVEYVRRLNYLDLPTSKEWGIRFLFQMSF